MTTALDRIIVPLAKRLIRQFGKSVSFQSVTSVSDLDPDTLAPAVSVSAAFTIRVTPPEPFKVEPDSAEARTSVGFMECYVSSADAGFQALVTAGSLTAFAPKRGDYLTIDGQVFRLEKGESVFSGDSCALYRLIWNGGGALAPAQLQFSSGDDL